MDRSSPSCGVRFLASIPDLRWPSQLRRLDNHHVSQKCSIRNRLRKSRDATHSGSLSTLLCYIAAAIPMLAEILRQGVSMNLPIVPLLLAIAGFATLAPLGKTQLVAESRTSAASADDSAAASSAATSHPLDLTYHRPSEKTKLRNYTFDTFGPYPIAGAAVLGAINQADKTPPEWGQGARAFGERTGSDFGIAVVTTTTRYALAKAFREDTLYYRCE